MKILVNQAFDSRSTVYRLWLVPEHAPAEVEWVCEMGGDRADPQAWQL
jgi:hypothetical protein